MAIDETRKKCFVIMPFSKTNNEHTEEYWNNHYLEFLKPLIETQPLLASRSSALRGDILRQIITDLVTAPVVVADLTDANPNVYWELGVRQSFKHCTITIAQSGTRLPFDLGAKGTLFYYPINHIKMSQFRKEFCTALGDCLANPDSPDSHVLETVGGRGTLLEILNKQGTLRKIEALQCEIKRNITIANRTLKTCADNASSREKKEPFEKRAKVIARHRTGAIESLVVDRHIEADTSFYELAEAYWEQCIKVNEILTNWCAGLYSEEDSEKELTDRSKETIEVLTRFNGLLLEKQKSILSKL